MSSITPELRAHLEHYEVPDCGCPVQFGPACQLGGQPGCARRRRKRTCDCLEVVITPPCAHILAAGHELDLESWAMLQLLYAEQDYREPGRPREPIEALPGPGRVEALAARHAAGLRLWHPEDVQWEGVDKLGRRIRKLRNGRVVQLGVEMIGQEVVGHADGAAGDQQGTPGRPDPGPRRHRPGRGRRIRRGAA